MAMYKDIYFFSLLILYLCILGFSEPSSLKSCSDDEILRTCSPSDTAEWFRVTWPNKSDELKQLCQIVLKEIKCEVDFGKQCPESNFAKYMKGLEGLEVFYSNLCEKSDALKQKFLRNIECLNNISEDITEECRHGSYIVGNCQLAVMKFMHCVASEVKDKCGQEAEEIYNGLQEPMIPIYEAMCKIDENEEEL
ncbi:uncharacterized protein LOC129224551 [Uloborus diversus]|uniref:uncharacterized protein LOC129224551 n=1 Tax=Uloborus diversus TaxID=327109 RepID=UPI00240A26DE|nr:uncharacterized protein LOC129224551 [Uloborus diversus]